MRFRFIISFIFSLGLSCQAFSKEKDYLWWIDRLNNFVSGSHFIAKQYNPDWYLPSLAPFQSGYNLVKDSYLVSQNQKEFNLNLASGIVIKATQVGGYLSGYAIPGLSAVSFMYAAYNTYPAVIHTLDSHLYQPINVAAENPILGINDFKNQEPNLVNSTYLSCSLLTHDKNSVELSKFIEAKDFPGLEDVTPAQYYNDHVIVYGRWLNITSNSQQSSSKNYVFATLESPAKLQEACLQKYAPYFTKILHDYAARPQDIEALNNYLNHEFIFQDSTAVDKFLIPTAGNFTNYNQYPILFYIKVKDKAIRLGGVNYF